MFERHKGNSLSVASLLSTINFLKLVRETDKNTKHTMFSIIKLHLFRTIKGLGNYSILEKYLVENEEESFKLGFYFDDNDKVSLPPKRTFNNYISQINKNELNSLAEYIISTATKNNILLDIEIVKKSIRENKVSYEKETREATKLVRKLIYPQVDLKIKSNGKFTTYDLLDVLVHVCYTNDFANNGAKTFQAYNERSCPSGDLMIHHFSKFKSVEQIRIMFDKISDYIFNFTKKNYNILNKRKYDIAYDIHKIPYFGKGIQYAKGGQFDRGTSNFLEFLTCSLVVSGRRFVLDVVPIHPLDDIPKLLDRSLQKVRNKIRIERAYLDRGFNSVKFFRVLKNNKVKFLMPMVRSVTVKSAFDKAEGINSYVFNDFKVGEEKVNLVLVNDKLGIKRAFVCNFDVHPYMAHRLYDMYSKRWGIETSYRNIDYDFQARTTTRNYHIRLFYFLFSTCLYNLWVLVNICVSLAVYGRIKDKPIVTAKLFAIILSRVKERIDSG